MKHINRYFTLSACRLYTRRDTWSVQGSSPVTSLVYRFWPSIFTEHQYGSSATDTVMRKWLETTRKLRYKGEGNININVLRDQITILEILSDFFSVFVLQTLWIWSYMKSLAPTSLDAIVQWRHQIACRRFSFPGFAQRNKEASYLIWLVLLSLSFWSRMSILFGEVTCWCGFPYCWG